MRIAMGLFFCLASTCNADDLIDVSIVMTAPAGSYGTGSIEGIFRSALEIEEIEHESLKAERISSYADYVTMRRMIEDPQGFLKINSEPVVYFVDSQEEDGGTKTFVVHESDPAKPVSGFAVLVNDGGKQSPTQWPLEAAEVTSAVFRVKSAETGDFLFSPDPTLDIQGYQLLYGEKEVTGEWKPWPGRRARFSVDIRGFPSAPERFAALKTHLENRKNRIEFTGVSSSLLSLVDASPKIGVVGEPSRLSNGVLNCTSPHNDADRVWYLLAITPAQQEAVQKLFRDGIASDTLDEFILAKEFIGGKSVAKYPVIPSGKKVVQDGKTGDQDGKTGDQDEKTGVLDGRTGPAWYELEKKDDRFVLSLDVVNESDWRKRFVQPGSPNPLPGMAIAVFEKEGELIRFKNGEFWLVVELGNWNGGTGN